MDYENVMLHVEKYSGITRDKFYLSSDETIRTFATAKNVNDECLIVRFPNGIPTIGGNGDKNKQLIRDNIGLETATVEKSGKTIVSYKIIGVITNYSSATVRKPPPNVLKALANDRCDLLNTSTNCEVDHRYEYSLYEDDVFYKDSSNYRRLHKVANSVDRERRIKLTKSGVKSDNREDAGCYFHTVYGTSKYNAADATTDQPSHGIYWENPKLVNIRDRELYNQYVARLNDILSSKEIVRLVNELSKVDFKIECVDMISDHIRNNVSSK
jgi:hypothetical protein